VALSVGCAGLGAVELVGGGGASLHLLHSIGSSGALVAAGAKFTVAFPITYHYLGALRHVWWDNKPDSLTNADVEKASYYLFGASTALSVVAMLF
jgi:succinate dehydrogenase (ubiquinone) cytochrome b560 subunit